MNRKMFLIHPWLFGLFPIFFLFAHNKEQLALSDMYLPLTVVTVMVTVVVLLIGLTIRHLSKAVIITSVFAILFFSYGHVFEQVWRLGVRHRHFLLLWLLLLALSAYFIYRTPRNLETSHTVLTLVATILLLTSLLNFVPYKLKEWWRSDGLSRSNDHRPAGSQFQNPDTLPDIYYLILDEYARADTLQKLGYDNSDFLEYLRGKGFTVIERSRSNYPKTIYSISSTLNFNYHDINTDVAAAARRIFQNHAAGRFLKARGYRYIHFGSWWQRTFKSELADENVNVSYMPEFSMVLYRTTLLHPLSQKLGWLDDRRLQWQRINYQFAKMAQLPERAEPTFALAHFIIPHLPYVFDANGRFLTEEEINSRGEVENYLNQLAYLNKKLRTLIDELLARSTIPPVIVLQSDHGTKFLWQNLKADYEDSDTAIQEVFGNFMAYYLPRGGRKVLYESITPVNSFPLIFNYYLEGNYPVRPDKNFFILKDSSTNVYQSIDVTEKTK